MKTTQIRELSAAEMSARIAELQEERFRLKFRGATEALNDPLRLRVIRRDIARLMTVMKEQAKQGGAAKKTAPAAKAAPRARKAGR
jgi:large subunit ribosomal protein L29